MTVPGVANVIPADPFPIIFFSYPIFLLAAVPIIIIESALYARLLQTAYREVLRPVAVSNLVSIVIGIPIAWLLQLAIQYIALGIPPKTGHTAVILILGSAVIPGSGIGEWIVTAAAIVQLLPAYFISVFMEYNIVAGYFRMFERTEIQHAVWEVNFTSYSIMLVFYAAILIYNIATGRPFDQPFNFIIRILGAIFAPMLDSF